MSSEFDLVGADLVEVAPVVSSREDAEKTLQSSLKYLEALQW
jgi:arginase family enzyme